jgi:hypothetical protein
LQKVIQKLLLQSLQVDMLQLNLHKEHLVVMSRKLKDVLVEEL